MSAGRWVCPSCQEAFRPAEPGQRCCVHCGRSFPAPSELPDLRLVPDPHIDLAADRDKGAELMRRTVGASLESTIAEYYAMTPGVLPEMAARYTAHALAEPEIGRVWLEEITQHTAGEHRSPRSPGRLLQVGCRTGGFLEVAARTGWEVAGIDIAFRWLTVARRRLESAGVAAELACANPEHIPLPDAALDIVVAADVLQHVADADVAIGEFRRVLRPGGFLYVTTPNRFSLGPEPHTWIWGLGYLPRRSAVKMARRRRQAAFEYIHPLSLHTLRRLLAVGWRGVEIWPGPLPALSAAHLNPSARRLAAAYEVVRSLPLASSLMRRVGPLLHAGAQRTGEPP